MLGALLCNLAVTPPPPLPATGGGLRRRPQFLEGPQPIVGRAALRQRHEAIRAVAQLVMPVSGTGRLTMSSSLSAAAEVVDELALILASL